MSARHRVFVTRELPGDGFAALCDDPEFDLEVWPGDFPPSREALLQAVAGVDGLVCLITDTVDEVVLDAAGAQLRVVSQMAVGVDNVDVAACSKRGIPVGNTPGVLTETTADMAWALILASARRSWAAEYVKVGSGDPGPRADGRHRCPSARRLGVIGFWSNRQGNRGARCPGLWHACTGGTATPPSRGRRWEQNSEPVRQVLPFRLFSVSVALR